METLTPKMCFCFNVLSSTLFPGVSVPVRDHPEKKFCVTFVTLHTPRDKSLANMATSHSDGFAQRMHGVGRGEPCTGSLPDQMSQLVSNKTTAGLLPSHALVFVSSLEQEGFFVSNHPQRVFSYCLTDLRNRNVVCFPTSLAPSSPVFCLGEIQGIYDMWCLV